MKKITVFFLFFTAVCFSQTKGISYQALIIDPVEQQLPGFNNDRAPLANTAICLEFSILDENTDIEYKETHKVTTDVFGMLNLTIGFGDPTGGYAILFENIVWSTLPKSLKVAINVDGNCTAFTEISNAPFTAVPFAFFSINSQDPPYTVNPAANYINTATSLKDADDKLDAQVKVNEDAIGGKVAITAIVNDLTTGGIAVPLSAEQGKELKRLIDTSVNITVEDNLTTADAIKALSANQGVVLKGLIDANITDIALKEDAANKSTDPTLAGDSDIRFPTEKAVKTYVDAAAATNANLTGMVTSAGNATTVVTNADLTGDVSSSGSNVTTIGASKVVTSMIVDGTIIAGDLGVASVTDTKLDKGNIPLSGFGDADADVNLGNQKLTDVANPTLAQDAATKDYVDTANSTNANLTGMVTSAGNLTTVVTNADLTGDVSSSGSNVTTIGASKVVTGMIVDGTIIAGDLGVASVTDTKLDKGNIPLSGFGDADADVNLGNQKLTDVANPTLAQDAATKDYVDTANSTNANLTGMVTSAGNLTTVVTNANLTGPITSSGNATSVASQTGTGSNFVMDTAPTLITPVLGVATATSVTAGEIKDSGTGRISTDGGNVTINSMSGRFRISATSSVIITNSFVDANSIIICTMAKNSDATRFIVEVLANAGSFKLTLNSAATVDINFLIIN
jgi:hypothetical protein